MSCEIKIDEFEGPLDLLLHLIKEAKVDILDISILDIANQYLDYINKMEEMNLNIASSYLVMASELIEIKSKLLLPRPVILQEEEEDPREVLINRLLEYQKYKEVTKSFKELENIRSEIYTKEISNLADYSEEVINNKDVTIDNLMDALKKFLERQKQARPLSTKVMSREITIEERRKHIKDLIKEKKKVNFFELFDIISKEYIVVTFLAILEMAKKGELVINQNNNFDEIVCEGR